MGFSGCSSTQDSFGMLFFGMCMPPPHRCSLQVQQELSHPQRALLLLRGYGPCCTLHCRNNGICDTQDDVSRTCCKASCWLGMEVRALCRDKG